jgi:hypothetical protein
LSANFSRDWRSSLWASPPLFDHSLLARLVEARLVTAGCAPTGAIWYEITDEGLAAVRDQRSAGPST